MFNTNLFGEEGKESLWAGRTGNKHQQQYFCHLCLHLENDKKKMHESSFFVVSITLKSN